MNRKISAFCMAALILTSFSLTGCGSKGAGEAGAGTGTEAVIDTATKEIRQNDYRGGVKRTVALQSSVLNLMENMKQNNKVIREDSPNSFWTAEGYQDFVVNFLNAEIIEDTQWCNEEETEWETAVKQTGSVKNSFTVANDSGYIFRSGVTMTRNEKDDYSISGVSVTGLTGANFDDAQKDKKYSGTVVYRILYDCDKDWCKAYARLSLNNNLPSITTELFEYARIDNNTFAVQTRRERLLIILDPVEADTDIRQRTIKEFYYSKLTGEGVRTTFEPYQKLPEYDDDTMGALTENKRKNELYAEYDNINEKGDVTTMYGINDSMFLKENIIKNINPQWVFEDKSLQQAITYKDGALVATTYNKLSKTYERFIYARENVNDNDITNLEKMVEIKNLVGIRTLPKEETTTQNTEESIETTTEATTSDVEETTDENGVAITTENTSEGENATETDTSTEPPEGVVGNDDKMSYDEMREIANNRQSGDVEQER